MVQWRTASVVVRVEDVSQSTKRCLWSQQLVQTKVLLVSTNTILTQSFRQAVSQSVRQSVCLSVSLSVYPSVCLSVIQWISQSVNHSSLTVCLSVYLSISRSFCLGQSGSLSVRESIVCVAVSRSVRQPVIWRVAQLVSQFYQTVGRSVSQSVSQSVCPSVSLAVSQAGTRVVVCKYNDKSLVCKEVEKGMKVPDFLILLSSLLH